MLHSLDLPVFTDNTAWNTHRNTPYPHAGFRIIAGKGRVFRVNPFKLWNILLLGRWGDTFMSCRSVDGMSSEAVRYRQYTYPISPAPTGLLTARLERREGNAQLESLKEALKIHRMKL